MNVINEEIEIKQIKYTCTNKKCGIETSDVKIIEKWSIFCWGIFLCLFWGIGFILMAISLFIPTMYLCPKCNNECKREIIKNNT